MFIKKLNMYFSFVIDLFIVFFGLNFGYINYIIREDLKFSCFGLSFVKMYYVVILSFVFWRIIMKCMIEIYVYSNCFVY